MRLRLFLLLPLALLLGACETVTGSDDTGAAGVAILPDSVRLAWGADTLLQVAARDSRGRPAGAPRAAAWSTSDTLVATVSDSGRVTARGAGTAVVTATVDGKALEAKVVVPFAYSLAVLEAPAAARSVYGTAINDAGQVVGYAGTTTSSGTQALLWDGGRVTVLGEGQAHDVNARGQVVGTSTPHGATLWSGGTRTLLTLGDTMVQGGITWANAINDAGDVVVSWRTSWVGSGGRAPGKVFLYRGGTLREVASSTNAEGTGINQAGWITGTVGTLSHRTQEGFLWRDGQIARIGGEVTSARDVNAGGQVVGGSYRAYLWQNGSTTNIMPADSTGRIPYMSEADGINDRGVVVGGAGGLDGWAWVWRGGIPADLNRLLPPGDWVFQRAMDVNNRGQIVGYGKHRATGEVRAMVASPVE